MKRLALLLVPAVLALGAAPATADGCGTGPASLNCNESAGGSNGLPAGYGQTAEDDMPVWQAQATGAGPLSGLPPGSQCYAAVNVGRGTDRYAAEQAAIQLGATGPIPACPADGAAAATRATAQRRIPLPHPHADPGRTFAGLPVYLEFGLAWTEKTGEVLDELPSRPVLDAQASHYEVQWAPGGPWEPVPGPGVSYQDRASGTPVTHQYRSPGTERCEHRAGTDCVTITVRVRWHLRVTGLDGAPLVFNVTSPAEAFELRVGQVQAVRRR